MFKPFKMFKSLMTIPQKNEREFVDFDSDDDVADPDYSDENESAEDQNEEAEENLTRKRKGNPKN